MKDYIVEAARHNIHIYKPRRGDTAYVKGYVLNKENNYVAIKYLDGKYETKKVEETTIDELNQSLEQTFNYYCENINSKVKQDVGLKGSIVALHLTNATLNLSLRNFLAGFCWLTCAGLYYLQIHHPLKLKRELKLVSWVYENRGKVNEIIKEEVDSKVKKVDTSVMTNNIPSIKYPTDEVPYSQNMYEDGINLNNIDELNNKQLRALKRKVLKKERRK